jgi:hypothetical protein
VELVSGLPQKLAGKTVVLDCNQLLVPTPSFLDEVVKQVLEVRQASRLEVVDASQRARDLISRSAANRSVASRLSIVSSVP